MDSLSRGMQQRLGLARVLIHDPKVLILDEPASGLDPRARIEMRELLRELKRMGKTIMISSHILSELEEICDRIGIIEHGQLVFSGTLEEIRPRLGLQSKVRVKVLGEESRAMELLSALPQIQSVEVMASQPASSGLDPGGRRRHVARDLQGGRELGRPDRPDARHGRRGPGLPPAGAAQARRRLPATDQGNRALGRSAGRT